MRIELTCITPEIARALLARSVGRNRPINAERVEELIEFMPWDPHDLIILRHDGTLKDGQHRLTAIVKSGQACDLYLYSTEKGDQSVP